MLSTADGKVPKLLDLLTNDDRETTSQQGDFAFLSPDGKSYGTVKAGFTMLWDVKTHQQLFKSKESIYVFPSGDRAFTESGRLITIPDGKEVYRVPDLKPRHRSMSQDGRYAVSFERNGQDSISVWRLPTVLHDELKLVKITKEVNKPRKPVSTKQVQSVMKQRPSKGGGIPLRINEGCVRSTKAFGGALIYSLFESQVTTLRVVDRHNLNKVWFEYKSKRIPPGQNKWYALSPDGKIMAAAFYKDLQKKSGFEINLIDTTTGKITATLEKECGYNACLGFSNDGSLLGVADMTSVRIYNMETNKLKVRLNEPPTVAKPTCLVMSDDNKLLAMGGMGSRIRLWNMNTGKTKLIGSKSGWAKSLYFFDSSELMMVSAGHITSVKITKNLGIDKGISFRYSTGGRVVKIESLLLTDSALCVIGRIASSLLSSEWTLMSD